MPSSFFEYFPVAPKERRWGIVSTGCGCTVVTPNSPYPPGRHPADHHFQWEQGRILQDFQILYISEGGGRFESIGMKPVKVKAGTAILLFPGVWHRYQPDLKTGWREWWIECRGTMVELLQKNKVISPARPIYSMGSPHDIKVLFEEALHFARLKPPGFSVRVGLIAVHILTLVAARKSPSDRTAQNHIEQVVSRAQSLMSSRIDGTLTPEEVARQLGVGYSYFRRMFKHQTGFSPKQYQAEIRLRTAKELLQTTCLPMQTIAEQLGYSSPYHFSLDFSKRTGHPPSRWRSDGVRPKP